MLFRRCSIFHSNTQQNILQLFMCNMISGCVLNKTYCSDKTYYTNLVLSLSSTQFNSADTKDNIMVLGSMSENLG